MAKRNAARRLTQRDGEVSSLACLEFVDKEDVFEGWFEDALAVQKAPRLAGVDAEIAEMPLPSAPPHANGRLAGSVWVAQQHRVLAQRIIAAERSRSEPRR